MSMVQGAMTGAQIGGNLGGGYGAAAGAIIGAFLGRSKEKEDERIMQQQLDMVKKRNELVLKEAARHSVDMQRHYQFLLNQTQQAIGDIDQQASVLKGAANAAMASYDIVGNTMQHINADVERQRAGSIAQELYNVEVNTTNLNNNFENIMKQARGSFSDPTAAVNQMLGKANLGMNGAQFMQGVTQLQGYFQGKTLNYNSTVGGTSGGGATSSTGITGGGGGSTSSMDSLF